MPSHVTLKNTGYKIKVPLTLPEGHLHLRTDSLEKDLVDHDSSDGQMALGKGLLGACCPESGKSLPKL